MVHRFSASGALIQLRVGDLITPGDTHRTDMLFSKPTCWRSSQPRSLLMPAGFLGFFVGTPERQSIQATYSTKASTAAYSSRDSQHWFHHSGCRSRRPWRCGKSHLPARSVQRIHASDFTDSIHLKHPRGISFIASGEIGQLCQSLIGSLSPTEALRPTSSIKPVSEPTVATSQVTITPAPISDIKGYLAAVMDTHRDRALSSPFMYDL